MNNPFGEETNPFGEETNPFDEETNSADGNPTFYLGSTSRRTVCHDLPRSSNVERRVSRRSMPSTSISGHSVKLPQTWFPQALSQSPPSVARRPTPPPLHPASPLLPHQQQQQQKAKLHAHQQAQEVYMQRMAQQMQLKQLQQQQMQQRLLQQQKMQEQQQLLQKQKMQEQLLQRQKMQGQQQQRQMQQRQMQQQQMQQQQQEEQHPQMQQQQMQQQQQEEQRPQMQQQEEQQQQQIEPSEQNDLKEGPHYWLSPKSTNLYVFPISPLNKLFTTFGELLKTDKPNQLNKGRDVKEKGDYTTLELVGIWRVENHRLWTRYHTERRAMREALRSRGLKAATFFMRKALFQSLRHLPASSSLFQDINETYLFHGTRPQFVHKMLLDGMALPPADNKGGALFGNGIYFAEDSCKNDQYGVGVSDNELTELQSILFPPHVQVSHPKPPYKAYYLFCCRVLIGYPVTVQSTDANSKAMINVHNKGHPIFQDEKERELACIPNTDCRYQSLVAKRGGAILRFREFCLFNAARCYPEYLVCYTRK